MEMIEEEVDKKILAVAIAAVLLEESVGDSIAPSIGRDGGSQWSIDHRRLSIGMTSQLVYKSRRGSMR